MIILQNAILHKNQNKQKIKLLIRELCSNFTHIFRLIIEQSIKFYIFLVIFRYDKLLITVRASLLYSLF